MRLINVAEVLLGVPPLARFCSVADLHALTMEVRARSRNCEVTVAGTSTRGVAIHDVRFGSGSKKALVLGGPHAHEPIGSLTVFSLMTLLSQENRGLSAADVEWHIVPCIDPDGALLNEGWTQRAFTFENYVKEFYTQPRPDQVDFSFPIRYKSLVFDRPSTEAQVLKSLIDRLRPDFMFTLHSSRPLGGAWFGFSRDIGPGAYREIYALLRDHGVAWQTTAAGYQGYQAQFSPAMRSLPTYRELYDYYEERGIPLPRELTTGQLGASSYEYLLEIKPDALVFVAELVHGRHPGEISSEDTPHNYRQLRLRLDADSKYLASVVIEAWESLQSELSGSSPFFTKVRDELIKAKSNLHEGITEWYATPIDELLFTRSDDRVATERDVIRAYMERIRLLSNAYSFVRLLKASNGAAGMRDSVHHLDGLFDAALRDVDQAIDLGRFEVINHQTLAKVQLGSGLIALNSLLAL